MPSVTEKITVDVPPDVLFDVITEYEQYPEFVPSVVSAEILDTKAGKDSKTVEVAYQVKVVKSFEYTLKMTEKRPKSVRWTQIEGPFKENEGGWSLKPIGQGQTEATYDVNVSMGFFVPSSISNMLVSQSLPEMLSQFKKRAEKRGGSKTSKGGTEAPGKGAGKKKKSS